MDRRIRLLVVIDSLAVGGAEALLVTFLQHVDHQRFDVQVLALSTVTNSLIRGHVTENCTRLIEWNKRRLLSITRIRDLVRFIRDEEIDIVHAHLLYSDVQMSIAGRMAGRPVVVTLHSENPSSNRIHSIPRRAVEILAMRNTYAYVIAVATSVKRAYTKRFGLDPSRVVVIPNAIDLTRFENLDAADVARARVEALNGAGGPLILAVGRIVTPKGFPDLVRAAVIIREQYPEARVVIVGREGTAARETRAEITRLGLEEYVRLLGPRSDVPQLLAAADVYVSSSWWEGAPLALLEAMAAHAPVVSTAVGGVPDVIRDGENGLLVKPHVPHALATAIVRLLDTPTLARCLSDAGHETVMAFGAHRWARRIEHEYLRILGHPDERLVDESAIAS